MNMLGQKSKVIFHIDGDAFFVGVEIAKNQKLKGLPVVTGEERGIVSALSYEAKALGITRGMPIFRVRKNFPNVIVLAGDYRSYVHYSSMMVAIVDRYAYGVEEYSIDECFADFTGLDRTLKMSYRHIAERIKKEIEKELGLSVSIGLAPTKVLSKIASSWVKPNGLTIIDADAIQNFLTNIPIHKVWGIGSKTAQKLMRRGVSTALDFSKKDIRWVKQNFSKPYETIWYELNGITCMEVDTTLKTHYSSIQKTRTFHPRTNNKTFLWSQLSKHLEDACAKARRYNLVPKKISIILKSHDFKITSSTIPLAFPSNSPGMLTALVHKELEIVHTKNVLYRTTGIILHDLLQNYTSQRDLFGGTMKAEKFDLIQKQIDILEDKFGRHIVYLASTQQALNRKTIGTDSDDLERGLLFL